MTTMLLFFSSCEKEPSAFFSVSSTKVQVWSEVELTNQSEDGESYSWNFDDGEKSSEENPKHTFNSAKNHEVSLTVYSKNKSKESTTTKSVKVVNYDPSNGSTYVVIEKLTITIFPLQNNENNWDSLQGGLYPDIYFSIVDVLNNNIYLAGSENRKDDETVSPTSWTWSTQGPVINTNITFKIIFMILTIQ